jgi:hypothetical protein
VIAKAERVDTTQLELEFAATLLFFDGTGMCVVYKRLDAGAFRITEPAVTGDAARLINEHAFEDLLAGIDLEPVSRRHREYGPTTLLVATVDESRASSGPGISCSDDRFRSRASCARRSQDHDAQA